jgi:WWE domain
MKKFSNPDKVKCSKKNAFKLDLAEFILEQKDTKYKDPQTAPQVETPDNTVSVTTPEYSFNDLLQKEFNELVYEFEAAKNYITTLEQEKSVLAEDVESLKQSYETQRKEHTLKMIAMEIELMKTKKELEKTKKQEAHQHSLLVRTEQEVDRLVAEHFEVMQKLKDVDIIKVTLAKTMDTAKQFHCDIEKKKKEITYLVDQVADAKNMAAKSESLQVERDQLQIIHDKMKARFDEFKQIQTSGGTLPTNVCALGWIDQIKEEINIMLKISNTSQCIYFDCLTKNCPSVQLFEKGIKAYGFNDLDQFFSNRSNWCIGHHGTGTGANLHIGHFGFDTSRRGSNGQGYGEGEYLSLDSNIALRGYSKDRTVLICVFISPSICKKITKTTWTNGSSRFDGDTIFVVDNQSDEMYILPVAVAARQSCDLPKRSCHLAANPPVKIDCVCTKAGRKTCMYYPEWEGDNGYVCYDAKTAKYILDAIASKQQTFNCSIGKHSYTMDIGAKTQTNTNTGMVRNIQLGCNGSCTSFK